MALFPPIERGPELQAEMDELLLAAPNEEEIAAREYAHEVWEENPESWAPLITLQQLADRPKLDIAWYAPDWIPVGGKTILSAEPKMGKTILLFHLLKAVTTGGMFLGQQCEKARVIYLTEQTEQEFKMQVEEVPGLAGNPNFFVLLSEETPENQRTWDDTIRFAEVMLRKTKSKILVVDTFGGLAKLPPGGENDSATIQNHINKMNVLFKSQRYLSIILTHHNRKATEDSKGHQSDGLSILSARGSSAFVGGGGHVIMMAQPRNVGQCTRAFNFYGRYLHGVRKTLTLTNGEYLETPFA